MSKKKKPKNKNSSQAEPKNPYLPTEMFRFGIDTGKDALRAPMIINGGAVVSLLALLGTVTTSNGGVDVSGLNNAMLLFAIAVGITAIAYGVRFLSQIMYIKSFMFCARGLLWVSSLLVIVTYVLFFVAVHGTYEAFDRDISSIADCSKT